MKKLIMSFSAMLVALSATLSAYAGVQQGTGTYVTYDNIKYEVLDNEAKTVGVAVQDADCPTYVAIPETITIEDEVYTVTQINAEAFKDNKTLFKVQFASTITDIGDRAFEECQILNFEELPANLLTIGDYAFKGCDAITRIKLPESTTTLGKRCFCEMRSLQRAILFSQVTELPEGIFGQDKYLEEVYLPENLLKIGDKAFYNNLSLEEVKLPSTLEEIGTNAFYGDAANSKGLQKLVLPPSVKKIAPNAFEFTGVRSVELGDLEVIPEGAFGFCYDLKEVVFPQNLKSIERNAFALCGANAGRSMANLVLPETLENITEGAFDGSNILSLTIGDGVTELPERSCGTPKILKLGSGIKTIHPNAFDASDLRIISIKAAVPPTVSGGFPLTAEQQRKITVIVPDEAAKNLYKRHIYWQEFNVVEMENSEVAVHLDGTMDVATAIYTASGIMPAEVTKLTVSGHLADKDFDIMREDMLSLLYLDMSEADNTEIPEGAFRNKQTLETVILPKGLKRVNKSAFQSCSVMNIEELPDGIEYIGNGAFSGCERITISRMPEALKELGYFAFEDCNSLKSITFGDQLEQLGGTSEFSRCDNLEYVDMSRATKLKVLSGQMFDAAERLHTLLLPESIEVIKGGGALIGGSAIKTLKLPGSLKTLEQYALSNTRLRALTFGEGITELPEDVLADNPKLLTVNLPSTLKILHESTFKGNKKISGISCLAKEAPEASVKSFDDINTRTCVLSVPATSFFSYLSAIGWGMFSHIENTLEIDIPEEVEITTVPEADYQDLVEEEESEQRALESTEGNGEMQARAVALEKRMEASNDLIGGALFCKLNNGAVMASEENAESKGNRIFIRTLNGEPITSVKIDDVEMVDQLVNNSLILPAGARGKLVVNGGNQASKVDAFGSVDPDTLCDVYSLTGQCVFSGKMSAAKGRVKPDMYVVYPKGGKAFKWVLK